MPRITDAQMRKLMDEMSKHGRIGHAAMKAGMDRKTARGYLRRGAMPSQIAPEPRNWRTRPDPLAAAWPVIEAMLTDAPELEAKTILEALLRRQENEEADFGLDESHLRTLQRRMKRWRAQAGPPKRVFFAQQHRPGEASQVDFTDGDALGVTIVGEPLAHKLCHVCLPYSNWQWATVCRSESMLALRHGMQAAYFELGRVPRFNQSDNSTAATHRVQPGERDFNAEYQALMDHFGVTPRTTAVGEKEQNGDIEALNGALKRRIEQHLLLRGGRDFDSVDDYEAWLHDMLRTANRRRQKRLAEELEAMRPLTVERLRSYDVVETRVSSWSTIRVRHNAYSVPSRLIGERVRVRVGERTIEVLHGGVRQLACERLLGRNGRRVDYRHVIESLLVRPGAFARYVYREEMFPTLAFRRAYDMLLTHGTARAATLEYLRLLHLAARTMQAEVEAALELLLDAGERPTLAAVRALTVGEPDRPAVELDAFVPDLDGYDALLAEVAA